MRGSGCRPPEELLDAVAANLGILASTGVVVVAAVVAVVAVLSKSSECALLLDLLCSTLLGLSGESLSGTREPLETPASEETLASMEAFPPSEETAGNRNKGSS